jgi:hypothetical protein
MSRRRIDGDCAGLFPAKAGPTREPRACSGISGAPIVGPALAGKAPDVTPQKSMVTALASSRLKPVPLTDHVQLAGPADHAHLVGPALAGKTSDVTPQKSMVIALASSRLKPVPLGNRVHAVGLAAHPLWDRL